MLRHLPILLVLIASPVVAQTATSEKQAALQELMQVGRVTETAEDTLNTLVLSQVKFMDEAMRPRLVAEGLSPAQIKQLFRFFEEELRKEFSDFAPLIMELNRAEFDRRFTVDEIKGLIEFYRTPLGAKVNRVVPEISASAMVFGQRLGAERGRRAAENALARMNLK